jgi:hypothetical protein
MNQIEHPTTVVLCVTPVLPCLTLLPREIRPRRTRPLARAGCKANQASGAARVFLLPFVPARAPRRQLVF